MATLGVCEHLGANVTFLEAAWERDEKAAWRRDEGM